MLLQCCKTLAMPEHDRVLVIVIFRSCQGVNKWNLHANFETDIAILGLGQSSVCSQTATCNYRG